MPKCAIDDCPNPTPSHRKKARFCSQTCFKKHKSADAEERTCPCGTPFTPSAEARRLGRGRFCSTTCAGKAARGKPRAPKGTNRTAAKTVSEWYYAHNWQRWSIERRDAVGRCERCGAKEPLCVHHKVPPYPVRSVELLFDETNVEVICTPCHAREHHDQGASSVCQRCGIPFGHAPSVKRVYCSQECDFAARREERRPDRVCLFCPTVFYPENEKTLTCSHACGMKLSSQVKQAKRPQFTCPVCKKDFAVSESQAARGVNDPCCSRSCAQKKRCAAGWNPMRAHVGGHEATV
jgi:hypothetical protein